VKILSTVNSGETVMTENLFATVHTSQESATLTRAAHERTIICRFRNPSRLIAINVSNSPWENLTTQNIPAIYKPLLESVLTTSAQSILSRYYLNTFDAHKITISQVPHSFFTNDNLLEEASGNNSEWLNKEELEQAWKASQTRAAIFNQSRYATDNAYRRAFTRFEELILKLSGKTSQFEEKELDTMLAKISDADLHSEFGIFVVRRIEAIKNRPNKQAVDMDIL
jgi:hypothetical protein